MHLEGMDGNSTLFSITMYGAMYTLFSIFKISLEVNATVCKSMLRISLQRERLTSFLLINRLLLRKIMKKIRTPLITKSIRLQMI